MKYLVLFMLFIASINSYSQKEGQIFCDGDPSEDYFSLLDSKKYIVWQNTYYTEEKIGEKEVNKTIYSEYSQTWETGQVVHVLLRDHKGTVYQYEEELNKETVRLPKKVKKGKTWKTADGLVTYEIVSLTGELKTPVCDYKNLLVLKSTFQNGVFVFYYQKGYGYIGATKDDVLISFVIPRLPDELLKKS